MLRNLVSVLALLLLVGCSGAASSPAPSTPGATSSGSPLTPGATSTASPLTPGATSSAAPSTRGVPTPAPTTIATVQEAAARVIELYPTFEGIGPKDTNLIGGCCSWDGAQTGDGFSVIFEVGWGDCPAGCIDRHAWTFAVARDGGVALLEDAGSPVPSGMPGSDVGAGGAGGIVPGGTGIQGHALAGPTCPVARPNDPACADRPLAGVTVIVLTTFGTEAARATTDANGSFVFSLPPGPYTIEPQPVDGMMRGPGPFPVVVGDAVLTVDIPYDTGIR
jgi:hypothetical protein